MFSSIFRPGSLFGKWVKEAVMNVAVLGSAGSGKTLLTSNFSKFLRKEGYSVRLLNLDPGVISLPYVPDFDVRNYFTLDGIMRETGLGPNGAMLEAMDRLIALDIPEMDADFVIYDTPGQLEVFAFRDSGRAIFKGMKDAYGLFVIDATSSLNALPGLLLYSLTIHYTLELERIINVVNKVDLIDEGRKRAIKEMVERFRPMKKAGGMLQELEAEIGDLLNRFVYVHRTPLISARTMEGFNELLTVLYEVKCTCGDLD